MWDGYATSYLSVRISSASEGPPLSVLAFADRADLIDGLLRFIEEYDKTAPVLRMDLLRAATQSSMSDARR